MPRILLSVSLAILLLTSCATQTGTQQQCTPQWPPGPCASAPGQVPKK